MMFIVSKAIKNVLFSYLYYDGKFSILCKSKKQAEQLAKFLNEHNDTANGDFKLKNNEFWYAQEIEKNDPPPKWKLNQVNIRKKRKITVDENC